MSPVATLLLLGLFLNPTVITIMAILLTQDATGFAGYLFVALRWAAGAHAVVFLGVAGYLLRDRKTLGRVRGLATVSCIGAILVNSLVVWVIGHAFGPSGGAPFLLVLVIEWQFAVVVLVGLMIGWVLGRTIFRQRNSQRVDTDLMDS